MASNPNINQYFNDTPLERNIREDTLRGVRWLGGEGVLEKDVGRQEGGLGRFQPRPVVDLRYDPTFSGSEFSPTLGQSLNDLRSADLYGVTGSQSSEAGGLFATPGASYRLMIGGKEVGVASTPQEMEALAALASEAGASKKADVRIQGKFGPTQDWTDTFINAPDVSGAGVFADFVLPAIGGVLLPGVGGVLGGALGAGLGAAAGSGLSSALQGRSLEDALTRAALSGVTAGGLSAATGTPLMSAASSKAAGLGSGLVPSDIAGTGSLGFTLNVPVAPTPNFTAGGLGLGGISGIGADALDDIVVTGIRSGSPSLISGVSGAAPEGIRYIADPSDIAGEIAMPEEFVVTSTPTKPQPIISGLGGAVSTGIPDLSPSLPQIADMLGTQNPMQSEEELLSQARRIQPVQIPDAALAVPALGATAALASGAGGPGVTTYTPTPSAESIQANAANMSAAPEIVVTASPTGATGSLGALLPGLAVTLPAMTAAQAIAGGAGGSNSTLQRALANAPQILGGLGALLGGGGGGGGGGDGTGGIGGGFDQGLSYQPLSRTLRPATFDPFTYGQTGGEFRFFNDQGPQLGIGGPNAMIAPPPREPVELARGGIVRGIGGGQDDLIDAKLSDGEYVFSAQDVAFLGGGSNEDGARKLDEMRKLIRKQAGQRNTKTIAKPTKSVSSLLRAVK